MNRKLSIIGKQIKSIVFVLILSGSLVYLISATQKRHKNAKNQNIEHIRYSLIPENLSGFYTGYSKDISGKIKYLTLRLLFEDGSWLAKINTKETDINAKVGINIENNYIEIEGLGQGIISINTENKLCFKNLNYEGFQWEFVSKEPFK